METKDRPGNRRLQLSITLSVSMALFALGITARWITPVMGKLNIHHTSYSNNSKPLMNCSISATKVTKTNLEFSEDAQNWLAAVNAPAFVVGSLVSRYITDRHGRKANMLWSALPFAIGTVVVQFPVEWLLYVTIIGWGIGTGMMTAVVGIYVAEISDNEIRGRLALCTKYMFNFGTFIILGVGPRMSYRTLNYCLLALPICYIASCFWIPETPYFYIKKADRKGDVTGGKKFCAAKHVLSKLKGGREVDSDLAKMKEDVKKEMSKTGTFMELMSGKQYRNAIYLATGLKVTQIMCGMVTIQQYLLPIMRESTFCMDESTALLIYAIVNLIASVLSMMSIDRFGRKPLLIGSYFGTGLCLVTVGIYFYCLELGVERAIHYGFVPFVGITLSNSLATVGFSSIGGVVAAEIFPMNVKAVAMTSLNILGGILGMSVAKMYRLLHTLYVVFWVYAGFAFLGGIFSCFYVTETKGKPLRDIVAELQGAGAENGAAQDHEMVELRRND